MNEPIRIDFEKGQLKTPEHLYFVRSDLAMSHWIEFEQLQAQAAYGYTFSDIWGQDEQAISLFNSNRAAEAITVLVNRRAAMNTMKVPTDSRGMKIDKKQHAFVRIACLFLIEEKEDMTKFNEEHFNKKVDDILDSGVNYEDLFTLAVRLVPGLLTAYESLSRIISEAPAQMKAQIVDLAEKLRQPLEDKAK